MKLFGFERRWMASVFDAIVPSGADERLMVGAADLPMERFSDELVAHAPARVALGFRAATWIIVLFGPLLTGRLKPFARMDGAARAEVLGRMEKSPVFLIRELPTLFKMLAAMGYCGAPTVQRALGITRIDDTPPSWMR